MCVYVCETEGQAERRPLCRMPPPPFTHTQWLCTSHTVDNEENKNHVKENDKILRYIKAAKSKKMVRSRRTDGPSRDRQDFYFIF